MSKSTDASIDALAEEVEKELSDRKRGKQRRREIEKEETDDNPDIRFSTPSVNGGKKKDSSYYTDKIVFELYEDMPNGTRNFTVPMPSEDEIDDETHKLNRLLSLYNTRPDRILNIVGEELPVVPKGDYSNPESVTYEIDIPPVPTLPNMLIYKARRLALRLKLIRWGYNTKGSN